MRAILCSLVLMFSGFGAHAEKLSLAVADMPPYTSSEYLADYGVMTEIINKASEKAGIDLSYELIPLKRMAKLVKAGRLDGAYPMTKSEENKEDYFFSEKILTLKAALFYRKDKMQKIDYANLSDLKQYKMGGVLGSFYVDTLKANGIRVQQVKNEELQLKLLEKDRVQLAPMDLTGGWNFVRQYYGDQIDQFDTLKKTFMQEDLFFVISRKNPNGEALMGQFNQALAEMKDSGEFEKILRKYNASSAAITEKLGGKGEKVCLALNGTLGDRGFNDMLYNGLLEASNTYDIEIAFRMPKSRDEAALAAIPMELAEKEKCQMVVSAGFDTIKPMIEASKKHPEVVFAHIDSGNPEMTMNFVASNFAQHQGSFVVGVLAARMSKTGKVAFLGGVDIPVVKAFETGFREGVNYANSEAEVLSEYVSKFPDFSGFFSPEKGRTLVNGFADAGADVVYTVAGGTGLGGIEAAKAKGIYTVGVDSDQDYLAKGTVLTSMMKRIDVAVFDIVSRYIKGELKGGTSLDYDYSNGGVSLSEMQFTKDLIGPDILSEIRSVEEKIAKGDIIVTDEMK